ncbi:hypothetical protein ZIOFF_051983 [Zingiber officinale]|uniref:Uncharacterized protein n=1 Tax=Zingiber officinale TaxID=94328 RepID=A0A8J5FNI6_ZINOF|nr:hypothetical protein ZIOFF_051983 [Zingiber officinale]
MKPPTRRPKKDVEAKEEEPMSAMKTTAALTGRRTATGKVVITPVAVEQEDGDMVVSARVTACHGKITRQPTRAGTEDGAMSTMRSARIRNKMEESAVKIGSSFLEVEPEQGMEIINALKLMKLLKWPPKAVEFDDELGSVVQHHEGVKIKDNFDGNEDEVCIDGDRIVESGANDAKEDENLVITKDDVAEHTKEEEDDEIKCATDEKGKSEEIDPDDEIPGVKAIASDSQDEVSVIHAVNAGGDDEMLEESFKAHNTFSPKQKMALPKQLNLRPRLLLDKNWITKIFSKFLHTEYGGPGTLLVIPFIDMADTLREKGLPGAPQAARAAVVWAQKHVDKDWKEWPVGRDLNSDSG